MKTLLLAASLAFTPVSTVVIETAGGLFVTHPETVVTYNNNLGHDQSEMMVSLTVGNAVTMHRVGVVGCADGKGLIARVNRDGTPAATANQWQTGGTKASDALAVAICAAAKASGNRFRFEEMV